MLDKISENGIIYKKDHDTQWSEVEIYIYIYITDNKYLLNINIEKFLKGSENYGTKHYSFKFGNVWTFDY